MIRCLVVIFAMIMGGCQKVPDPCSGYRRACIAVTVESGPASTYQLGVSVREYPSTNRPFIPESAPEAPLSYPLRFAIRFGEFDDSHGGKATVEIEARDDGRALIGFARETVSITGLQKVPLQVTLGAPPPDLSPPPDLRPPPADLLPPLDLLPQQDLAPAADLAAPGDAASGGG